MKTREKNKKGLRTIRQLAYLKWKVDKYELDTTIAAAELLLFETQEKIIELKKLYRKNGYDKYPIVRKEASNG